MNREGEVRTAQIKQRYRLKDGTVKEYYTIRKYKARKTKNRYTPEDVASIKDDIIKLYVDLEQNLGYSEVYRIISAYRPNMSLHMIMKWMKELESAGLINLLR